MATTKAGAKATAQATDMAMAKAVTKAMVMVTWAHGYMDTLQSGYMATWLFVVAWPNGYTASPQLHGYIWVQCYKATWPHGYTAKQPHRCLASSFIARSNEFNKH